MKKLILIMALAGMICFPALAAANTVIAVTTTPIASTQTDWASTLAFQKFDGSLGTLTQIQLYLASALDTVITVQNLSGSPSSGNVRTELQVFVWDPLSLIGAAIPPYVNPKLDFMTAKQYYTLNAYETKILDQVTANDNDTYTYTALNVLNEFTGTGTILLNAQTFTETVLTNTGGNTAAAQLTNADLTGTITYTYTPTAIPIPSTVLLLGSGLVGLGLLGRRKLRLKK